MKILVFGDIVARRARKLLIEKLPFYKEKYEADFIIANGENASTGNGITSKNALELFGAGVDVITSGNHIFDKKEVNNFLQEEKRLLRPYNYPGNCPGRGFEIYRCGSVKIAVLNLCGVVFMPDLNNPFLSFDEVYEEIKDRYDILIIDFHAEATSEKISMGYYTEGKANAFFGTHTHVQTADDRILTEKNKTGYITDVGMVGPINGVIGVDKDVIIKRLMYQRPNRFDVAEGSIQVNGCLFTFDDKTFDCISVERIYDVY